MLKIDNILLSPQLYIVSTPIGNLKDITIRALSILKNCDIIACEDTRVTKKLLSSYQINSKKLFSLHEHSPQQKLTFLIDKIKKGKSIALVSDAGTPLISDPGYKLVSMAIEENLSVVPVPGPSAVTASLVSSGIVSENFYFVGFLPAKENKKINTLKSLLKINTLLIFFESPKRLQKTLESMLLILGDRKCAILREITKYYETAYRGKISKVCSDIKSEKNMKGEITIIIDKPYKEDSKNIVNNTENQNLEKIFSFAQGKISTKNLATLLSIIYKKPKKFFYSQVIKFVK